MPCRLLPCSFNCLYRRLRSVYSTKLKITGVYHSVADAVPASTPPPLTSTLALHVRLPGSLQMVASSRRAELNGILAFIPDGATIRITCPSACCRRTTKLSRRGLR